jgi:hypothetical protein
VLALPGCFFVAATAVGAAASGAVLYENNEAWMDFKDTMAVTWSASLRAAQKLGYQVVGQPRPDVADGRIELEGGRLTLEVHPGGYVRVRARIGNWDTYENERRAKALLAEVLAQMPPPK